MSECKFCNTELNNTFLDLGMHPLCNANIKIKDENKEEKYYPLKAYVCTNCFLVQIDHDVKPEEIFTDYTYFSSYSSTWLDHAKEFSYDIIKKLNLNGKSFVVEIASNDGYLLKNFKNEKIECLGIEPASNVAEESINNGISTVNKFFNYDLSHDIKTAHGKADLIIANNVFAHVPEINNFVMGIKNMLSSVGVFTIEVPYLDNLIKQSQFDTIYHEHFFYYSFYSLNKILETHGLKVFDVEKLPTHGGSLRIYSTHNNNRIEINESVRRLQIYEIKNGVHDIEYYNNFKNRVQNVKNNLLKTLIELKEEGKKIIAYGAPGKGNTLLNYCGIKSDIVEFTVDRNPNKQNTFLPGSRIPVYNPIKINEYKPDYILILPWNLKKEIIESLSFVREWEAKFIIPIPEVEII